MRIVVSIRALLSSRILRTWLWVSIASICPALWICGGGCVVTLCGIDLSETASPRVCLGASNRSIEISRLAFFLYDRPVVSVPSTSFLLFHHGACFPLGSSVSLPCPGPRCLLPLLFVRTRFRSLFWGSVHVCSLFWVRQGFSVSSGHLFLSRLLAGCAPYSPLEHLRSSLMFL